MPTQLLLAVVTTLAIAALTTSVAAAQAPATCLLPPLTSSESPRSWHILLPTLTIGFDARPQRSTSANDETRHLLVRPNAPAAGAATYQHHDDSLLIWTIGLSWSGDHASKPSLPTAATDPHIARCQTFYALHARRPTNLDSAIDHWAQTESLRALLRHSGHSRQAFEVAR